MFLYLVFAVYVTNAEQFTKLTQNIQLNNSIDLSQYKDFQFSVYQGVFEGNNYKIRNLQSSKSSFFDICTNCIIRNVQFENFYFKSLNSNQSFIQLAQNVTFINVRIINMEIGGSSSSFIQNALEYLEINDSIMQISFYGLTQQTFVSSLNVDQNNVIVSSGSIIALQYTSNTSYFIENQSQPISLINTSLTMTYGQLKELKIAPKNATTFENTSVKLNIREFNDTNQNLTLSIENLTFQNSLLIVLAPDNAPKYNQPSSNVCSIIKINNSTTEFTNTTILLNNIIFQANANSCPSASDYLNTPSMNSGYLCAGQQQSSQFNINCKNINSSTPQQVQCGIIANDPGSYYNIPVSFQFSSALFNNILENITIMDIDVLSYNSIINVSGSTITLNNSQNISCNTIENITQMCRNNFTGSMCTQCIYSSLQKQFITCQQYPNSSIDFGDCITYNNKSTYCFSCLENQGYKLTTDRSACYINTCKGTPEYPCGTTGVCKENHNSKQWECECNVGYSSVSNCLNCSINYIKINDICYRQTLFNAGECYFNNTDNAIRCLKCNRYFKMVNNVCQENVNVESIILIILVLVTVAGAAVIITFFVLHLMRYRKPNRLTYNPNQIESDSAWQLKKYAPIHPTSLNVLNQNILDHISSNNMSYSTII